MVSIYLAQAIKNSKVHVKDSLDRFRVYVFIDDVVQAWFRDSTYEKLNNISINIGTDLKTSVNELLELIKY